MIPRPVDRLLVLSDLHLGPQPGGPYDFHAAGHSLEDAVGCADADAVVLNGDVFDLLEDDDPLSLDPETVQARLRAILATEPAQALVRGLRSVVRRGGEVVVRPGNHDLELHLDEAVAVLGEAVPGARVDPAPVTLLTVRGRRVAIDHGHDEDDWNRYAVDPVRRREEAVYPPGSRLVKGALNPARAHRNLRFLGVLAPDWLAAGVAAVAVDPGAVKVIDPAQAARIAAVLGLRGAGLAAVPAAGALPMPEGEALPEDAAQWLAATLGPGGAAALAAIGADDRPRRAKVLRWAFVKASRAKRWLEERGPDSELTEAIAVGHRVGAEIVLRGHTHGPRGAVSRDGVTFANSGSWTLTMASPAPDAAADWEALLDELAADPGLVGAASHRVGPQRTAVLVDDAVRTVTFAGAWSTWSAPAPGRRTGAPMRAISAPPPETGDATVLRHLDLRLEALLDEVAAYERRPDPLLPEGHRAVFADACRHYAHLAGSDASVEPATDLVRAQAVWNVVRELDGQRRGRLGGWLERADAIAWAGYEEVRRRLPAFEARAPFPLCVLDPDYGPATTPRGQAMRADRLGLATLQALVPLVFVPPDHLACPRWLALLLHEVGHDIDVDAGLSSGLEAAVAAAAPDAQRRSWEGWTAEMLADVIGWRLGGRLFLQALREVAETVVPFRMARAPAGGAHPPLALRFAVLEALGAEGPEVELAREMAAGFEGWWEAAGGVAGVFGGGELGAALRPVEPLPWATEVGRDEARAWTAVPERAPWQPTAAERAFLDGRLPSLAPTEVGPGGWKKPPAALMKDYRDLVFVGEVHDQLGAGLRDAVALRGGRFGWVEVFVLDEEALRRVALDDADAQRLLRARADSVPTLCAALPELAERWVVRAYHRPFQYLAAWFDGRGARVHTSARLWGVDIKTAPGLDWRTLDLAAEDPDAPIRRICRSLAALREESTVVAQGGVEAGGTLPRWG